MQLTEGKYYDFELKFIEWTAGAFMILKWSAKDIALEIIPSKYFFNK